MGGSDVAEATGRRRREQMVGGVQPAPRVEHRSRGRTPCLARSRRGRDERARDFLTSSRDSRGLAPAWAFGGGVGLLALSVERLVYCVGKGTHAGPAPAGDRSLGR